MAGAETPSPTPGWIGVQGQMGAETPRLGGKEAQTTEVLLEAVSTVLRTLRPVRDPAALPAHGFVISFTRKKKISRLHHLGSCFRLPGLHYLQFVECGDTEPDVDRYMYKCRDCWPVSKAAAEQADSDSGSESSSSNSSSTLGSDDSKDKATAERRRQRARGS